MMNTLIDRVIAPTVYFSLGLIAAVCLVSYQGVTRAQTTEKVLFESAEGQLLDNWTPWVRGGVQFDPVMYDGLTHVTLDFSLSEPAASLEYSHYSGWREVDSYTWSDMELTNLTAGRQQHTILLGPETDRTIGSYFNAPGVTFYSAVLNNGVTVPPEPDPEPGLTIHRIVPAGTIGVWRRQFESWNNMTHIRGRNHFTYKNPDNPDDPLNGTVHWVEFGELEYAR